VEFKLGTCDRFLELGSEQLALTVAADLVQSQTCLVLIDLGDLGLIFRR
jgi:hypothetical protein